MYKTNATKALVVTAMLFTSIGVTNFARAITVIDTNLPPAVEDWGNSTSLNSLNNVGALTCSGLNSGSLEHCQTETDFDISLSVTGNSGSNSNQNNLQNDQDSDGDTSSSNTTNTSGSGTNSSGNSTSSNSSGSNSSGTSNGQLSTSVVLNEIAIPQAENIDAVVVESTQVQTALPESKEPQVEVNKDSIPIASTIIADSKPETIVKKTYVAKKKLPINNTRIEPVETKNIENNSVEKLKNSLEQLNKEVAIASADVFKDWTQIKDSNYQADPTLIYVWFALAGFQSLFIAIYLAKNTFGFEKTGQRK